MLEELQQLMKSSGAILEGHFQLTSGRHSDVYLEKYRLLELPDVVDRLGKLMAGIFQDDEVDIVLGAATGGILLSHATAKALGTKGIFAERIDGALRLRRGFEISKGERILIVEDIVTTGGSVVELVDIVRKFEAEPLGVVCLVDRTERWIDIGCRFESLLRFPAVSWEPEVCPLCSRDIPIESRGRTGKR